MNSSKARFGSKRGGLLCRRWVLEMGGEGIVGLDVLEFGRVWSSHLSERLHVFSIAAACEQGYPCNPTTAALVANHTLFPVYQCVPFLQGNTRLAVEPQYMRVRESNSESCIWAMARGLLLCQC